MPVSRQTLGSVARHFTLGALVVALLGGCGWPRVHKVVVQQGNVITQAMVDQLKPGMTRSQVAYIMGEPVVRNTFNDARWDYVYTLENPGFYEVNSTVSLFFSGEKLSHFSGDIPPTTAQPKDDVEIGTLDADAVTEAGVETGLDVDADVDAVIKTGLGTDVDVDVEASADVDEVVVDGVVVDTVVVDAAG